MTVQTAPVAPVDEVTASSGVVGEGESVLAVGQKMVLSRDDQAVVRSSEANVQNLKIILAERVENFEVDKMNLLTALGKARQEFAAVVKKVGNDNGLKIDESAAKYGFDSDTMTFTRTE